MADADISIGGGGGVCVICAVAILMILHTSCTTPDATTGMLHNVCVTGMTIWDWLGTICCGPVYLFLLVIYSTGVRLW